MSNRHYREMMFREDVLHMDSEGLPWSRYRPQFTTRPLPYHWVLGWRDQQRHCMNISIENAKTARKVAPDMVGRYARMALAHYRQMRKHERMMEQYE